MRVVIIILAKSKRTNQAWQNKRNFIETHVLRTMLILEVSEGWLQVPRAQVDLDSSHPIGLEDTNTLLWLAKSFYSSNTAVHRQV